MKDDNSKRVKKLSDILNEKVIREVDHIYDQENKEVFNAVVISLISSLILSLSCSFKIEERETILSNMDGVFDKVREKIVSFLDELV
jgi:hypothetical protein